MKDRTIDVRKIARDIRQSWMLIIVFAVVLALLFGCFSGIVVKNVYKSTAEFAIIDKEEQAENRAITDKNDVMKTLQETCLSLCESDTFVGEALSDAGYSDISPAAFVQSNLKTKKMQGVMFSLEVSTDNAEKSFRIAESLCEKIETIVPTMSQEYTIITFDKPVQQTETSTRMKAVILGGLIGILLALMFILLRGLTTLRIRDQSDIELVTELPVIADCSSGKNEAREEAIRGVKNEIEWQLNGESEACVVFTSDTNSPERDNICFSVANLFAATNKKTIIIDAVLSGDCLTNNLGKDADLGLSNIFFEKTIERKAVSIKAIDDNALDFIPRGKNAETARNYFDVTLLKQFVSSLYDSYDLVIICTNSIDESSEALLLSRLYKTICIVSKRESNLNSLRDAMIRMKCSMEKVMGIVLSK